MDGVSYFLSPRSIIFRLVSPKRKECSNIIEMATFPSAMRGLFSDTHFENVVKTLELKFTEVWGPL